MKQSEINELSTDELVEHIEAKTEAYHKKKLNHKITENENPISVRDDRRTVARLQTELRKRQLAEANK